MVHAVALLAVQLMHNPNWIEFLWKATWPNIRSGFCGVFKEIQKLWRSVAVDGVDERNIEEYLQRHSIVTMQDHVMKKVRSLWMYYVQSRSFVFISFYILNLVSEFSLCNF